MCGLVGYNGKESFDPSKIKILFLYNQERGEDSAGAYFGKPSMNLIKMIGKVGSSLLPDKDFMETPASKLFIGHTRKKTYGDINKRNAHPFDYIGDRAIIGAHNGTLKNFYDLRQKYDYSYNEIKVDSEIIFRKLSESNDFKVLNEIDGAAAILFTVLGKEKEVLYAFRNKERPLYRGNIDDNMYISSIRDSLVTIGCNKNTIKEFAENYLYEIVDGKVRSCVKLSERPYDNAKPNQYDKVKEEDKPKTSTAMVPVNDHKPVKEEYHFCPDCDGYTTDDYGNVCLKCDGTGIIYNNIKDLVFTKSEDNTPPDSKNRKGLNIKMFGEFWFWDTDKNDYFRMDGSKAGGDQMVYDINEYVNNITSVEKRKASIGSYFYNYMPTKDGVEVIWDAFSPFFHISQHLLIREEDILSKVSDSTGRMYFFFNEKVIAEQDSFGKNSYLLIFKSDMQKYIDSLIKDNLEIEDGNDFPPRDNIEDAEILDYETMTIDLEKLPEAIEALELSFNAISEFSITEILDEKEANDIPEHALNIISEQIQTVDILRKSAKISYTMLVEWLATLSTTQEVDLVNKYLGQLELIELRLDELSLEYTQIIERNSILLDTEPYE